MITLSSSIYNHDNLLEAVAKIETVQNENMEKCQERIVLRNIIESLCQEKRQMTIKYATTTDEAIQNVFKEQIKEVEVSLQNHQEQFDLLPE